MYSSSLNNPDRVMTVFSHEILTVALLFLLAFFIRKMVVNAARTGRTSTIFVPTDMSQMTLGQTLSKLQASEAAN